MLKTETLHIFNEYWLVFLELHPHHLHCEIFETLIQHSMMHMKQQCHLSILMVSIIFSVNYDHDRNDNNDSNNTYEITNIKDHSTQFTIDCDYSQIYLLEANVVCNIIYNPVEYDDAIFNILYLPSWFNICKSNNECICNIIND